MMASVWDSPAAFLTVLTPLVAVPLTVITFYLRSLREQLMSRHEELVRRLEATEAATIDLRKTLSEVLRDYTSKEEWLRECMHTRRLVEQLAEASVRIETIVRGSVCPSASCGRASGGEIGGCTRGHGARRTGGTGDEEYE